MNPRQGGPDDLTPRQERKGLRIPTIEITHRGKRQRVLVSDIEGLGVLLYTYEQKELKEQGPEATSSVTIDRAHLRRLAAYFNAVADRQGMPPLPAAAPKTPRQVMLDG